MSSPRPGLGQRQAQGFELRLEPRLLQSLEVLALPAGELAAWLREAYTGNEALRLEEPPAALPRVPKGARAAQAPERDLWELREAPALPWRERLSAELGGEIEHPELLAWTRLLVECLDDDGLLSLSDEALLESAAERGLAGGRTALGRAIARVQALEPRGIGGRDLVEVLLLQLDPGEDDYPLLCALVEGHLEDLLQNRLPRIRRALGLDYATLERLRARLAGLEPAPARRLETEAAPGIHPELSVRPVAGGFELEFDRAQLPRIGLEPSVERLAADRGADPELRRHLRSRLEAARGLMEAVALREDTLLRLVQALFRRQTAFLERGPTALVPLTQAALAEELGVHPSTVSRAVAGKYVETPHGVLSLRSFFQAPAPDGEAAASSVRRALAELVAEEDPARPLSDDDLAARLAERGWPVARRTVAKMRGELGIQSSYRRRRFAA